MKASLVSGIASLLIVTGGSAFAADMPLKAPPPPLLDSSWTGSYIGVSGGWIGGGTTSIFHGPNDPLGFPAAPQTNPFSYSGALFGITDGYNLQYGSWVIGYESDTSIVTGHGAAALIPPANTAYNAEVDLQYLSTWRARVGWLWTPNWLIYGTGGAALADMRYTQTAGTGISVGEEHYVWGYAAGAGVEWKFAPSYSVKLEYTHVGFQEKSFLNPAQTTLGNTFGSDNRVKTSEDIVRLGLNVHYDLWSVLFH
jgi:outer membrane immunogenic protein